MTVLVNEMPTLAVTVWFFVVLKVRYRPSGFVTGACSAGAASVPCTVGSGSGRTVRSAFDPANTLVDGAVAFGVAAVARLKLFWVTGLEFWGHRRRGRGAAPHARLAGERLVEHDLEVERVVVLRGRGLAAEVPGGDRAGHFVVADYPRAGPIDLVRAVGQLEQQVRPGGGREVERARPARVVSVSLTVTPLPSVSA